MPFQLKMTTLQKGWHKYLNEAFQSAVKEIIISSPYISDAGAEFLLNNISKKFKTKGILTFFTDLSPKNIYQGSTDIDSFKLLFNSINFIRIYHIPKLHSKVYICDAKKAIVTSGNFTAGGLYNNFEYGIFTNDSETVSSIRSDLIGYENIGALFNENEIDNYCRISSEIKELYKQKDKYLQEEIQNKLNTAIIKADNTLIKAKLGDGTLHNIFEKTIVYILQKHGALPTAAINQIIEDIHPDICDNQIDRIINGINFGKKWKHAVRTAQQHLKKKGRVKIEDGKWFLI